MSGRGGGTAWRAAAIAAALALPACATGGAQIHSDLDAIQQQLWKVQKDNAALSDEIRALRAAPPPAPGEAPAAAESRLRLEALERDLLAVRSRLDDHEQRAAALASDLRAARESVEALRVALAGAGAVVPPGAAPVPAPAPPGAAPPGLYPAAGAPAAGPASAAASDEIYRRAYTDFSRGDYALAQQGLEQLLRQEPQGDLADDAQYLLGETYSAQGRFAEAITAYEAVTRGWPRGDRAASAFLKKGIALLEVNRTADAVIQFQHVVSTYPKSEEARLARERLRALGLRER